MVSTAFRKRAQKYFSSRGFDKLSVEEKIQQNQIAYKKLRSITKGPNYYECDDGE